MSCNSDSSCCQSFSRWLESVGAFLILRLFLGLRLLLAGLDKFINTEGKWDLVYYKDKVGNLADLVVEKGFVPIPEWMGAIYANVLGWALIGVGALILVGLFTRISLILGGLLFVSLSFGLMALPDAPYIAYLGIHVGLTAFALILASYNPLSVDGVFGLIFCKGKSKDEASAEDAKE